jgi:hypothetical protein
MPANNDDFTTGYSAKEPPLSGHQKDVLDFAKQSFGHTYERDHAINEKFGLPSHVYFDQLSKVVEHPEASSYAPDVTSTIMDMKSEQ